MNLQLKKILYNLSALADLGQEITSAEKFNTQIRAALYVIMGTFIAVKGAILFYQRDQASLVTLSSKGFDGTWPEQLPVAVEQIAGLEKNRPYTLGDGRQPEILAEEGQDAKWLETVRAAGAALLVPLWTRDRFVGALFLSEKLGNERYTPEDFDLLRLIAHQMAITLHNHELFADLTRQVEENRRLYDQMRRIYHDTIQAFAAAIDAKDVYTKNHSYRVARYVVAIGRELGWAEQEIEGLYIAGLLHDVGKIILRDEILKKQSPLSQQERDEVQRHSMVSFDILSKINFPWANIVSTVRHHHERLDGNGYPDALKGEELSEGEKILILADSFDAMTTDRPYRKRLDLRAALEELTRNIGTQFDPRIMTAFCNVLDKEINHQLPNPDILPHLASDFDPSIIVSMLRAITQQLST